ncbi:DUF4352 domain-containing protein [Nonomuraea polychroma]|uniref:DUF4352 domain-containing protein n=1 Tax=Nonomuraea polychroma TaxID=46176 RepID=UPI003D8AEA34
MSYPQQPPGQQPPHGHGYGYGYQPPPPPEKGNLAVILLLAIGLPLLLLGGCGAVFFVLTADQSSVAAREALQTEADEDPPDVQLDPGTAPPPSAAPEQTTAPDQTTIQQQQAAKIGDAITLEGNDPGLKVAVTVNWLFSPATPADTFTKPQTGKRFVAVEVTLTNQGQAVYSDSPTNGAVLIDAEGQQYRAYRRFPLPRVSMPQNRE